jgi:hydroxylamine reductase
MLHLGIQKIKLGPQLPAFVSPNVLAILQEKYQLQPVNLEDHDADLKEFIGRVPR